MDVKTLVQFIFATGDTSCEFYEVYVLVERNGTAILTPGMFRDAFEKASMDCSAADAEYEDGVEATMLLLGVSWQFAPLPIGSIDRVIPVYI